MISKNSEQQMLLKGGGRLDRMNLRNYAICHCDRSKMVKEIVIEPRFSNT